MRVANEQLIDQRVPGQWSDGSFQMCELFHQTWKAPIDGSMGEITSRDQDILGLVDGYVRSVGPKIALTGERMRPTARPWR